MTWKRDDIQTMIQAAQAADEFLQRLAQERTASLDISLNRLPLREAWLAQPLSWFKLHGTPAQPSPGGNTEVELAEAERQEMEAEIGQDKTSAEFIERVKDIAYRLLILRAGGRQPPCPFDQLLKDTTRDATAASLLRCLRHFGTQEDLRQRKADISKALGIDEAGSRRRHPQNGSPAEAENLFCKVVAEYDPAVHSFGALLDNHVEPPAGAPCTVPHTPGNVFAYDRSIQDAQTAVFNARQGLALLRSTVEDWITGAMGTPVLYFRLTEDLHHDQIERALRAMPALLVRRAIDAGIPPESVTDSLKQIANDSVAAELIRSHVRSECVQHSPSPSFFDLLYGIGHYDAATRADGIRIEKRVSTYGEGIYRKVENAVRRWTVHDFEEIAHYVCIGIYLEFDPVWSGLDQEVFRQARRAANAWRSTQRPIPAPKAAKRSPKAIENPSGLVHAERLRMLACLDRPTAAIVAYLFTGVLGWRPARVLQRCEGLNTTLDEAFDDFLRQYALQSNNILDASAVARWLNDLRERLAHSENGSTIGAQSLIASLDSDDKARRLTEWKGSVHRGMETAIGRQEGEYLKTVLSNLDDEPHELAAYGLFVWLGYDFSRLRSQTTTVRMLCTKLAEAYQEAHQSRSSLRPGQMPALFDKLLVRCSGRSGDTLLSVIAGTPWLWISKVHSRVAAELHRKPESGLLYAYVHNYLSVSAPPVFEDRQFYERVLVQGRSKYVQTGSFQKTGDDSE